MFILKTSECKSEKERVNKFDGFLHHYFYSPTTTTNKLTAFVGNVVNLAALVHLQYLDSATMKQSVALYS